jgi:opacity protein-like surface antigen
MIRSFCLKLSAALAALLVCVSLTNAQTSVAPPAAGANPVHVAGTDWNGSESLDQFGKLTFRFDANDQVLMIDEHGEVAGHYSQNGASVQIQFADCVYEGVINGNVLSGNARFTEGQNAGHTWTFSVTLQPK